MDFKLVSKYKPSGDQPQAIDKLVQGINDGLANQVLEGVTGSGKTFTMANIIEKVNRPTLVIAHNKTLAAQLCNEFKELFPENRVEFFVSYYDYYQPESYIVSTDTYIEKDMAVNDEIDKLRASATNSLLERRDVIVVASVSCIYGLGNPDEYYNLHISLRKGDKISREEVIRKLVNVQYERNEIDFKRSTFRSKGDILDIFPSSSSQIAIRVEFFGDEIDRICEFEATTGDLTSEVEYAVIYPATHYAVGHFKMAEALKQIEADRIERVKYFKELDKPLEAERISQRVSYDIEMMREIGYCSGIENYSRYFDNRSVGQPPYTLIDYFPSGFLTLIDESHMTIPQIKAMYNGDKARKTNLVDYGFRLPAAFDNRPLNFEEFNSKLGQTVYISATPAEYELEKADQIVHQIIRPTGLLDPIIEIRKIEGQVDQIMMEADKVIKRNGRILITTLTKKMAESLTSYLLSFGYKVRYMHSDIDTLERVQIVNSLRLGEFDILIGINLLREGLDMPEVELVCILDADKEGFLRSARALIQTIGRAARNANGKVIMFADQITDSMEEAITTTENRRKLQEAYNKENGIVPKTIIKPISNSLEIRKKVEEETKAKNNHDIAKEIESLTALMKIASNNLDYERAISLRDKITALKKVLKEEK